MHQDVIEKYSILPHGLSISVAILQHRPVICNLSSKYNIAGVQPIDMFPHTHHVENIVLMNKAGVMVDIKLFFISK